MERAIACFYAFIGLALAIPLISLALLVMLWRRDWQLTLRESLAIVTVFAVLAGLAAGTWRWRNQIKADYVASQVIVEVASFVDSHAGQWPASWDDIPEGDIARQYVRIDFATRAADMADDPQRIQAAIVPISGSFHSDDANVRERFEWLNHVITKWHESKASRSP